MAKDSINLIDIADKPLFDLFFKETELQAALRQATIESIEYHQMMTSPEQVQLLAFLIKMIKARRAIEVGVFSGYGTLAIAQALPEDGLLIACDKKKEWPMVGYPFWEQAGVLDKIDLHIAPAMETLQALLDEGQEGSFDFVFIDADKIHYREYAEFAYKLLRKGGLIVFDNVVRVSENRVIDAEVPATRSIAALLESISQDERFDTLLLPIDQGMLLATKRGYNE